MKFQRDVSQLQCTVEVLYLILLFLCIVQISCYDHFDLKSGNASKNILHNVLKFTRNIYNVTIPENSIGKTYATPKFYDVRLGIEIKKKCNIVFRIISGDRDKLFKAEERIVGNFAFLAIRTRTSNVVLNREKSEEYILNIKAHITCLENEQKYLYEDDCLMNLQVLDRNDLTPLFYPTEYSVTIPEDLRIHSSILQVTAEDADLGLNGEIYYSFLDDNNYFSIHPSTGIISNLKQLEYLGGQQLDIFVLAVDRGSALNHYNHHFSKAKVQINIEKTNLFNPEIYVTSLTSTIVNYNTSTTDKICGIIYASDRDSGRNGEIKEVKIVSGDPDGNFHLTKTETKGEYYIHLNKLSTLFSTSLNVQFNLTIRVEDNGVPMKFSSKVIPIVINLERKSAPIFTKEFYEVSIPETSPSNMPVIRLKVTDPDLGKNALVFLEIVGGNEGGEFRINPDSGMLYTQKSLDAEKTSFYTLTVSAIDQANLGAQKQSSTKVKINILDINDNDPIFDDNISTVFLNENELGGIFVTKVSAKDKDSGENSYISYSIANLNDVPFDIDHFSGVIRTTMLIDYEVMSRVYKLRIRASDWGLPFRRQTEKEILIKINNINDNRPQFERINCIGKIFRHAPVGTDIFTLSAIDFDVGDYVTYRLLSGNEDGCFNLDPTTGIITIGCDLRDVRMSHRSLNVSSTDGTHFSDEMAIELDLLNNRNYESLDNGDLNSYSSFECHETGIAKKLADILATSERNNMGLETYNDEYVLMPSRYGQNLHNPEFINFPFELKINESLTLGETIIWFKAKDRDLGYNGKLIFGISDGDFDSVFRMDPDSGELLLIGYLDRERQEEYVLNITVCDLGQPCKCASKMLTVKILDVNDNPPVIQKPIARFHLREDVVNQTLIFCLKATDADFGINGLIAYEMKAEMYNFALNASTGCLFVNGKLDREEVEEYELQIIVKDKGYPSLTADAYISIIVEDINDNAPIFGVQEIIFKVREDVPKGTLLAQIEASDFDSGLNGEILFSLKEDSNSTLFKIDKYSGVIRTQAYFDYESQQVHNLVISAIDRGTPALTSSMPVVVEIIDVNENRYAPEFEDYVYTGFIKENKPKGSIVMNITAKDLDPKGPDSEIEYFIRGGDGIGIFSVNDKGLLRTLCHLDAESKRFYWLTLCAQDHGIVPLISCVQVYIEIENVNDNVPLTEKPVYYPSIKESSPPKSQIILLNATDGDVDVASHISYKIISGNPEGFFEINKITGEILTTERKLDRENQAEHILEINISDNGQPALYSTTRVVITVDDINDNSPQFDQRFYKVQVPSSILMNVSITQIQATDKDVGDNGKISYSIKSGKGKNKFRINSETGAIYVIRQLDPEGEYELIIKAEDHGFPRRSQSARLNVVVTPILEKSLFPPKIKTVDNIVEVTESDKPGFLVTLIQVTDEDSDYLWYNISGGNGNGEFYIGHDNGNVLLSKSLDWEVQQFYNLTISVTDGSNVVETQLYIHVVDINDNRPQFSKDLYVVNISESIKEESIIMQLHATDEDEEKKIFYTLHGSKDPSSLHFFRIDSVTGNVVVTQRLDYERIKCHVLTVIAKDQGTPAKRNYAKIIINVHDHNDHYPEFTSKILQTKIPESAAIKSKVAQLNAIDRDSGKNGEIKYSIVSGNVGNVFEIDSILGTIYISQSLNIMQMQEYMLQIKAVDCGNPRLSSQIPVHIVVVMADNDPPKFSSSTLSIELYENHPVGHFITKLETRSSSSVFYNIVDGNDNGFFYINPSTGVMLVNSKIDYEEIKQFNLTVKGTNMASASALQHIIVHILDINDNAPFFIKINYYGEISEASEPGTFVSKNNSKSLIFLKAADNDSGLNSILEYKILDEISKQYFEIDSSTGAIKLLKRLDYESKTFFKFNVMVNDKGVPKMYSRNLANVLINVLNVNDCSPEFTNEESNSIIYLPTFEGISVTQIKAIDKDTGDGSEIRYDIVDGNLYNTFEINKFTGEITLRNISKLNPFYALHIRASDGMFSTITQVDIDTKIIENPKFLFQREKYEFSTVENSTKISIIGIVNVIGNSLFENVEYRILNPTALFEIGKTSGVIKTRGPIFDREIIEKYVLIIEAVSVFYNNNISHFQRAITQVTINILDINDNCPIFVNLPYYATVSMEDLRGSIIINVKAIDLDSYENGEVRYEMKKGNGELFKIDRKTGDVSLKQNIEKSNKNYEIIVAAYDNAITPCYAEAPISIKIVDKSMPVFNKQFYSVSIREDIDMFSALSLSIQAESPLQRDLIFTISSGNDDEFFEIDYRTGILYVVNNLDFERQRSYELFIRATDSISGVYAEVTVSILVEDANDCYPHVEKENYNITLPENLFVGSQILKVNAADCDSNANAALSYVLESINGEMNSDLFYIDIADGSLYLKHQLNYEECRLYLVVISVNDHGTPSLRSRANIWIKVEDLNDNAPRFIEPSFSCKLSISAKRGQFVTIAKAYDADKCDVDKLLYKIVDGNEHQVFSIDEYTGLITLQNNQRLQNHKQTVLNISVTDGLHTSFARVKINLLPENINSPVFEHQIYDTLIYENESLDKFILTVKATDNDFGLYASLTYEIVGDDMIAIFMLDEITGSLYAKDVLDREEKSMYDITIKAVDGGGKFGYTVVKVKVGDLNDNTPIFLLKDYKIIVKEDTPINSIIGKVKAIDMDDNNNSFLNYTLENATINHIYKDFFSLSTYGDLRLIKSLKNLPNALIEFFVRATDNGFSQQLYNILPVSIQVVNSNILIPAFEKTSLNINVEESFIPGSVLVKLKITGNFSVKFSLVTNSPKFSISENGEIMLMEVLDREVSSVEHIIAMSETATVPVLYAYIDIYFNIKDENDNFPKFTNIVYNIDIPENTEKGSSILKVTAKDPDEGPNGDVRYYLEDETYSKEFEIDIYSGWITLLTTLDRELHSEYYFNILASDNGQPKQISKVPIAITVTDYNDNAPMFKEENQYISISENAIPGTVLTRFLITDMDSHKNNLYYYIIAGDSYSQFHISNTGELFVSKKLDRESIENYNITVAVTDGKFISYSYISINIDDENDNFPICLKPRYNITVNESILIGTSLIQINAVDLDASPNNKIRYYITGNYSDDFHIDKDSGELKIANQLDREKNSIYILLVHVQDNKELLQECICEVFISVSDVNDNKPEFSMKQYVVSISEDAQVNTIVTKIHATDKDFGLNRKLAYSFLESNDFFHISRLNGTVKLIKPLDRENISIFNISIKAEDYGNPPLFSKVNLIIHVLDINDNPPVFNLKQYKTFLFEKASIDSDVIRVYATSEDIGINAEILYYIVGGNEQSKFKIDHKTGLISVNLDIDYEKTKSFFLTIQAIDGGIPPLSSQAFVNITILDVNDNVPQFAQNIYRVRVTENAKKGENIAQIIATDEDSDQNGSVIYNIERGDRLNQFSIDEFSGNIYVNNELDRETIASYALELRACDNGTPQLCSYVQVFIDVLDINDNPPVFKNSNYSVVVQENKPLGFIIITFELSDADEFPNSSPFTFDFKSGNEGGFFRIEQDGSLRTAARFNHRICDQYILQIRVFDNGNPPLYSDAWISIKIIEESQYPPQITPLEITVNSYDDDFVGGFLGKIYVSDLDKYDTFTFELAPTNGQDNFALRLFNISHKTGDIYALKNLDVGLYQINVTVSDGKFTSHAIIRVNVEIITNEMVQNSVIIKFANITPRDFILSHRKSFIRSIREIMRCSQKDVIIIAINQNETKDVNQNGNESLNTLDLNLKSNFRKRRSYEVLDVVFTVRKQQIIPLSENYYTSEEIRHKISKKIEEIEYNSNLLVEELVQNECIVNTCVNGKCKKLVHIEKNNVHTYHTDVVSYVTPTYEIINSCLCKQGFDGKTCNEPINACSSDPCSLQKQCWPADTATGYQCICPTGYSGFNCEIQAAKCLNDTCSNFQTPVSFNGKSYAHYKINKSVARSIVESKFSFSLNVRTVQQSGTLVYASGQIDYNIIEISNGVPQYRFDLGSGEGLVVVSSVNISDGNWHSIKLDRVLNTAKVVVDNKHFSQGSAPGVNIILNLQTNDIFIGAEVKPHHTIIGYEDIHRGFIGCMTDLRIGKEMLPFYISGGSTVATLKRFTNVEFLCDPAKVLINLGICGSQPCLNSGLCQDFGEQFKCLCPERFSGKLCEIDLDPCASSPCVYGGHCENFGPNNYSCICPSHLSGKRCEYGKFCSPNPCKNGGICEEGDGVPHCMCRGFTGTMCELDVDECENHPCGSGATCINEAGSFRCICPSYLTGVSCGDPLYSNSISTKIRNFSVENITGIICGISIVFIFCTFTLFCIIIKKASSRIKREDTGRIKNSYRETTLNSLLEKEKNNKQNAKMSNLEVNHRPISYTQSSTDNMFSTNTHFVNNLDILRSYGSAGDELESIAFEYQKINLHNQNVNINNENISDVATSYKTDWCHQMQLKTFCENKLNNGKPVDCRNLPVSRLTSIKSNCGKLMQVTMPNVCQSSFGGEYPSVGQYHWDCSDWARNSQNPLPDITEVPAEIADSSSFHSNESNESKTKSACNSQFSVYKVNPTRDIATLPEDMISDSVDSELQDIKNIRLPVCSNSLSRLSPIYYSENEDYTLNSGEMYVRHPDTYLPPLNNLSETEGETNDKCSKSMADWEYAKRKLSVNSEEVFLCNKSPYSSNISVHLCEIEDSELEEFLPKKKKTLTDGV